MASLYKNAIKFLTALLAITALLLGFAYDAFPHTPAWQVLFYSLIAIAIFCTLAFVAIVIQMRLNQTIIKAGGIDPAWFWFKANPPGFANKSPTKKR
ncbi:hypothetical protein [Undibacterium fentianense]|uniref:Uncharacterized protein n=1 Tax=Undibacterium fentianense TaxID=2828728 RepID=A0A941E5W9_9BURK|nr:hypothetical protein [Undibacterium fentianense]MBR7801742.1 hypothetical protein [Undibacterium fentianense]